MCGIAGIINSKGLSQSHKDQALSMMALLRHRGPDGEGCIQKSGAVLVQTRLAMLDLTVHDLPFSSQDSRYSIVYNGELYNHQQLRNELQNEFHFQTRTDTEVLLAGYIVWGEKVLERLEGMFSFFIWDQHAQTGFAARDPMGVKPFFYYETETSLMFASEPQALIRSGAVKFRVNDEAIAEFLTAPYFSSATQTPFQDIKPLPAGASLRYQDGKTTLRSYYRYRHRASESFQQANEQRRLSDLRNALEKSVTSCLQADVPVGLFLSGGLDSTLIGAMAVREKPELPTWTVDYPENEELGYGDSLIVKSSDWKAAREAIEYLKVSNQKVSVAVSEFEDALDMTLKTNDLLCAWEQEVSQNVLAAAASRSVKAVLVGDCADETHFGYRFLLNPEMTASPSAILSLFGMVPLNPRLVCKPLKHFNGYYREFAANLGHSWDTPEDRLLATSCLVSQLWLPRLLYNGDVHSMAYSLEARVPFANWSVLNESELIGSNLALKNGIEKWHLRKIAEEFLPPSLSQRTKSALSKSFAGREVIRRKTREQWKLCSELVTSWVDRKAFEEILYLEGPVTDKNSSILFRVLSLMTWIRSYQ